MTDSVFEKAIKSLCCNIKEIESSETYEQVLNLSEERKLDLGLSGKNLAQLRNLKIYKNYGYELHHIVPKYKLHYKQREFMDNPDNISLLSVGEHILAHFLLVRRERNENKKRSAISALKEIIKYKADVVVLEKEPMLVEYFGGLEYASRHIKGLKERIANES